MSGFKEPSLADRQKAAQQARQNMLNKFRSQPGLDDPAVALSSISHRVGASITLQFVRPDIRQSCILLLAVSS
ncbi:MAG: hypothetical protein E6G71_05250 [Alphaproteobacteria bacterium]|nr:MAG: hypothetical protein E6G71_05250 [Alphaproteobacteria bacterium]